MTHALYLARRALADGGEPMLLPQGGWQGDWGNAMPVETAFAESYGAPSLGGPYGNPTPGPIAVESSPLGAFNSGSGDTSGAAAPGSGRGPSSYSGPAQSLTGMDNLPSEILNGSTDYNGISQPGYNSSLGPISSTPLGPPDLGSNAPVTSGPFGWAGHSAPYGSGPAGMATLGPVNNGVQSTPAYDQMGNPMGFSTSNNFMDGRGYGQAPSAATRGFDLSQTMGDFGTPRSSYGELRGMNSPSFGSLSYDQFSQPNVGINDWSSPSPRDFGSMDYGHLDGMDFGGAPASSYGPSSSPRGSSYNGAFSGQPFDMQGDYGTGGKNSTRAGNVGPFGSPVTSGMTPGFAAPSKGVAYGDEMLGDFNSVAPISVSPAIPTGFYDPMTGFSANLSGWGGGVGGGDYAGGGFGGGAPGLGGGVMGGDPAMGGGDRGMNRGGRVGREDGGRISPFGEADDVALQRAAKFAGMVQSAPVEHPRHALEARLAPDEAARMDLSGYMMPNRAAAVVNTEAGAELRDPDGNKVDWIKRPAVLPFTVDNGDFRWAMPAVAELAGNVMGGVAAPVKGAEAVLGSGPIRRAAQTTRADNPMVAKVHGAADTYRQHFLDLGVTPSEVNYSVNRNGDPSAYFNAAGQRWRISDHDTNPNFRTSEMTLFPQEVGPDRALEAVEAWKRQQAEIESAKIAALAKQNAAQASAIERAQIEQANRDAKNAFWRERGLENATETARNKAWKEHKKSAQGDIADSGATPGPQFYSTVPPAAVEDAAQPMIRAYHGSPHNFDRFSLSKIGTGEGAQAYGHGLYFAENENIARSYRDALSSTPTNWTVDGTPIAKLHGSINPMDDVKKDYGLLIRQGHGHDDAISQLMAQVNGRLTSRRLEPEDVPVLREKLGLIEGLRNNPLPVVHDPGHMYEVAIKADPEKFLDWDKPLREQPHIAKVLPEIGFKPAPFPYSGWLGEKMLGESDYPETLLRSLGEKGRGEQVLREAGIPGIKYLDAGSRNTDTASASRNYVVFDDNLIDILRKYGIGAGAVGAGGAMAVQNPQGDQ